MTYLKTLLALSLLFFLPACSSTRIHSDPPPPVVDSPTVVIAPASEDELLAWAERRAAGPLDAEIPADPAIRIGSFDNGLRYYIRANSRPEERAELRLVVDAGSVLEDEDQLGLAHFVEHMAFNGTRSFEKQALVDYLESIGLSFGPDLNAYTSFDETVYLLKVPTDDPVILATAFQILEEWAHAVVFDAEEIDKERGVVVEEWRLGRGAGARLRDQQLPVIFRGSRYAERLPIGEKDILENAPHETLRRFYRDWYRPDLMAVVAVGDFDPDGIYKLIEKHFAGLPKAKNPPPRERYDVPAHDETLFSIVTDPETTATVVSVNYKHPAAEDEGTFGAYRRSLVESLYHGMLNERLAELAQKPDPPYVFAFSTAGNFVRTATIFSQEARVRDGDVLRGLEALLTEVERVDRHGFTAGELERAKIDMLRGYEQAFRERDKARSGSLAAEYVRNFLEDESLPGIAVEVAMAQRFLPTIELDEVNRQASEWITDDNRVILVSGPEKDDVALPSETELLAVFDAVIRRDIEPWVDQVRDEPLLATLPEPGEIVEERHLAEIGVTEWRLGNGVRVFAKPTDFQNDQILLRATSPGGHSLVTDEDHTSASFATTLTGESGLGEFSQIELTKALAGTVAGVEPFINELEEGFTGGASPQDLETLFQLLYLRFTAPRLDLEVVESLDARIRTLVQNRSGRPETVFFDKLTSILSQDHPRHRPLTEEVLSEIDPEKAFEIYRQRFADAGDFTFFLVGNFDLETLKPLVQTYLGSLPSTGRDESWRDLGVRPPDGVVRFEVEKGLEPKSRANLIFSGPAEWSRENQHLISSLAQVLRIRLRESLREDLGATYGVSVGGRIAWRPVERYTFSISFGSSPEDIETLVTTVFAEIEKLKTEGIDDSYLQKVKETQRRKRETDLRENRFWLRALESHVTVGLDPRLILDDEALVESLTPERIQAAARRYLSTDDYVLGILYPEPEREVTAGADGKTAR